MNPHDYQAGDSLEKRRRQIDRAKAAHLSRQLQTRLQYARLKVDHGWQKQTLNEVENLYFHHYRARAALRKANVFSSGNASVVGASVAGTTNSILTPNVDPNPTLVTSTSATINPMGVSNTAPNPNPNPEPQNEPAIQPPIAETSTSASVTASSKQLLEEEEESEDMDVDAHGEPDDDAEFVESFSPSLPPAPQPLPPVTASAPPSGPSNPPLQPRSPPITSPALSTASITSPLRKPSATPQLLSSTAPMGSPSTTRSPPTSSTSKLPIPRLPAIPYSLPKPSRTRPTPSSTTRSPFPSNTSILGGGTPPVALTYDSFWSTHSASTYRSPLLSTSTYPSLGKAVAGGYPFVAVNSPSSFPNLGVAKGAAGGGSVSAGETEPG